MNEPKKVRGLLTLTGQHAGERLQKRIAEFAGPFRELMAYYRCAMMEVSTKFNVLNEELSLQYDRNPIETIKTRLKTPESIIGKLRRRGLQPSVEAIESDISDVAGVRVICAFPDDIYMLADALLRQDDIRLIEKKDYIKNPKPNGYRSLHLIVEVPIFLHDSKRGVKVEVQLRTISMDWWASLEHRIRYKKELSEEELAAIDRELLACADVGAELDRRMESVRSRIEHDHDADCHRDGGH